MITIKKLNKKYGKRRIKVYNDNKYVGEISEFWHWLCISNHDEHEILRKVAMENLWWLLHTDNLDEDVTEQEAWEEKIKIWDKGKIYGVALGEVPASNFYSEEEKQIALNSINNR